MQEFRLSPRAREIFREKPSETKAGIAAIAGMETGGIQSQKGLFLLEGSVRVAGCEIVIGEDRVWDAKIRDRFGPATQAESAVVAAIGQVARRALRDGADSLDAYGPCDQGGRLEALLRGPSPDRREVIHENSPAPRPEWMF